MLARPNLASESTFRASVNVVRCFLSVNDRVIAAMGALQDIPDYILYQILGNLDLKSQRSVFLSSAQLYGKWQLQIPKDPQWQFIANSVSFLAKAVSQGFCHCCFSDCLLLKPTDRSPNSWSIICKQQDQGVRFDLWKFEAASSGNSCEWTDMTEDQLWHRLSGSPAFASALLQTSSERGATSHQLTAFAQQLFQMLHTHKGILRIYVADLKQLPEGMQESYKALKVWHAHPTNSEWWEIDGERCIVSPPNLDFENMPAQVTAVQAVYFSQAPSEQPWVGLDFGPEAVFFPGIQVIHDFAYNGNVYVDVWSDVQRSLGNTCPYQFA